jgi:glutathione synthase/RimK-type ligase-like ATP-grasp enzyme
MKIQKSPLVSAELMAELQEAAANAAKGVRDPCEMRQAAEHMDQLSEEIRKQVGLQNIGVDIIREMRGPLK